VYNWAIDPETIVRISPRARAAASLRELGHEFVARQPDAALLQRVAERAAELRAELADAPVIERSFEAELARLAEPAAPDGPIDHSPTCPVSGQENPQGLAMTVRRAGNEAVGTVTLGDASAGPPGIAHGGAVAGLLDDIMGFVLDSFERTPGFTATLNVRFLAPVPVGVELAVQGKLSRREGRKLFMAAAITRDGATLAQAEALFVAMR
jgi:acyl-coenzyme A thioesterase PaaI-like protein